MKKQTFTLTLTVTVDRQRMEKILDHIVSFMQLAGFTLGKDFYGSFSLDKKK